MKFGIFYEHQIGRPWERRTPSTSSSRTRSSRSSWPTRSASSTCGRSSTTSSRSTATRRRPRSSWPRAASARKNIRLGHGIILTAPRLQPPGPHGRAGGDARPRLERPGRVRLRRVVERGRAGGFGIDPLMKREQWLEGLEVAVRCMTEDAVHRRRRPVRADAAAQRRAQAGAEAAPAAVGGVLAGATRSCSPPRRASARSPSPSSTPRRRGSWVAEYERTLAERACRWAAPSTRRWPASAR